MSGGCFTPSGIFRRGCGNDLSIVSPELRLKHRDRQVFRVGELSQADVAAIAAIEVPSEAEAFDHELEGDRG